MMSTAVKIINDGVLKLDGGSVFGPVPKVAWESNVTIDRKNRISLGLNCLLLQVCGKNVLVDTRSQPLVDPGDPLLFTWILHSTCAHWIYNCPYCLVIRHLTEPRTTSRWCKSIMPVDDSGVLDAERPTAVFFIPAEVIL